MTAGSNSSCVCLAKEEEAKQDQLSACSHLKGNVKGKGLRSKVSTTSWLKAQEEKKEPHAEGIVQGNSKEGLR